MGRRAAAGATAGLAVIWVVAVIIKLASGYLGHEARKLEAERPTRGHEYAVTIGVVAVVIVFAILAALMICALLEWRGNRAAGIFAAALTVVILMLTVAKTLSDTASVGQWLAVVVDAVALGVILLGLRAWSPDGNSRMIGHGPG
jgi:hypothetical protein